MKTRNIFLSLFLILAMVISPLNIYSADFAGFEDGMVASEDIFGDAEAFSEEAADQVFSEDIFESIAPEASAEDGEALDLDAAWDTVAEDTPLFGDSVAEEALDDSAFAAEVAQEELFGSEFTTDESVSAGDVASRDIILVLDNSGSMNGTPTTTLKQASNDFCATVLDASKATRIGIVTIDAIPKKIIDFTNDLDKLKTAINSFYPNKGMTNIVDAIDIADNMLKSSSASEYDIVIMTDGIPNRGRSSNTGRYTDPYCNAVYDKCSDLMKNSKIRIYTVGFFNGITNQSQKELAQKLLRDCQNSGFFDASEIDQLLDIFKKIATDILRPLSVTHEFVLLPGSTPVKKNYKITTTIENKNNKNIKHLVVNLILHEGGTLLKGEPQYNLSTLEKNSKVSYEWEISVDPTLFPQGGIYTYQMDVIAEKILPIRTEGSIPLNATDGESNELDFSKDTWKFRNVTTACVDHFKDEDMRALMNGLNSGEKRFISNYLNARDNNNRLIAGTRGHCYGMATSVILNKVNIFDLKRISNAACLHDVEQRDAESVLTYYSLMQFMDAPQNEMADTYQRYRADTAAFLNELAEKAEAVKTGGTPVLLCIRGAVRNNDGSTSLVGHAIVAHGIESGTFESSATGKTYNRKILLYDSNFSAQQASQDDYSLLFNENSNEWEIPAYASCWNLVSPYNATYPLSNNTAISLASTDLQHIDPKNYAGAVKNYHALMEVRDNTNLILKQHGNAEMDFVKEWKLDDFNGLTGTDTDLFAMPVINGIPSEQGSTEVNYVLPDSANGFSVTSGAGNLDNVNFDVKYKDYYLNANAESAKAIDYSPNGKVSVSDNAGAFAVELTDNNAGGMYSYTVSGTNTQKDVQIESTDLGVKVTGENLKGVTITARNDTQESLQTISLPYTQVELIGKNTNGIASMNIKLNAPKKLKAETVKNAVRLSWDASPSAKQYAIYRKSSTGATSLITTVYGLTALDTTCVNGEFYEYFVTAVGYETYGLVFQTSEPSETSALAFVSRPSKFKASLKKNKKLKLSWMQNPQATGYELEYAYKSRQYTSLVNIKDKAITSTKTSFKLKKGSYFFRMRSYLTVNGTNYYSDWSKREVVVK